MVAMQGQRFRCFLALLSTCLIFLSVSEHDLYSKLRQDDLQERRLLLQTPVSFTSVTKANGHRTTTQGVSEQSRRQDEWKRKISITTKRPPSSHSRRSAAVRLSNATECSCNGEADLFDCCQRALILVHKMGVMAAQELSDKYVEFDRHVESPEIMEDHQVGEWFEHENRNPRKKDYRHVVITRNWYDAIISGYLYHKSGKECWLDWFGNPGHEGWLLNNAREDWERRLLRHNFTKVQKLSWKPGNGRDLCRYLADESEEDGLLVYTAWAMASFMFPLLEFRQQRQEVEEKDQRNRTIYICYEQLTAPSHHSETLYNILLWIFPNRVVTLNAITPSDKYQGGHATDQNMKLRGRLQEILVRIDSKHFKGAILRGNAKFGCGKTSVIDTH